MSVDALLLTLVVVWAAALLFGELAERLNQPAVLGELLAGVVVGAGGLGLVDPHQNAVHLLAEIGVVILLFQVGLEIELRDLLRVGPGSSETVCRYEHDGSLDGHQDPVDLWGFDVIKWRGPQHPAAHPA